MRLRVQSLASLNGMRTKHCCGCGVGSCSSDSTPSLGTSICLECSPKKQLKKKKVDWNMPQRAVFLNNHMGTYMPEMPISYNTLDGKLLPVVDLLNCEWIMCLTTVESAHCISQDPLGCWSNSEKEKVKAGSQSPRRARSHFWGLSVITSHTVGSRVELWSKKQDYLPCSWNHTFIIPASQWMLN